MNISEKDIDELKKLEESLWKGKTRFDQEYMDEILSPDFFEFGRSGRRYKREHTLAVPHQEIRAVIKDFKAHSIDSVVVLVTYISEVTYEDNEVEKANRSSLWIRMPTGWQIRFHQGTAVLIKQKKI